MADNVPITPGSGTNIAADELTDPTLGLVKVQYVKLMDGTLDSSTKAAVTTLGLKVDMGGMGSSSGGTAAANAALAAGVYNATPPVLASGQQAAFQLDASGRMLASINQAVATTSGADGSLLVREQLPNEYLPQILVELRVISELLNEGLLSHLRSDLPALRTDLALSDPNAIPN